MDKINGKRIAWHASIFCGTIISIWSVAAFMSGLAQANWQISELLRQYLVAAGLLQEFHTLSDFYTHIKGVEYIIVCPDTLPGCVVLTCQVFFTKNSVF
jgi:hypothetical protein